MIGSVSQPIHTFSMWSRVKPKTHAATWPSTHVEIRETGIQWEETQTTRSGLFGRKSESVKTTRIVPLADVRTAKRSWGNIRSEDLAFYLTFETAQGEIVILALISNEGDTPAAAAARGDVWGDQLREAVTVLRAYDIRVDDPPGSDVMLTAG
jgi:hypothetical protein